MKIELTTGEIIDLIIKKYPIPSYVKITTQGDKIQVKVEKLLFKFKFLLDFEEYSDGKVICSVSSSQSFDKLLIKGAELIGSFINLPVNIENGKFKIDISEMKFDDKQIKHIIKKGNRLIISTLPLLITEYHAGGSLIHTFENLEILKEHSSYTTTESYEDNHYLFFPEEKKLTVEEMRENEELIEKYWTQSLKLFEQR